mgnify:CR=1 FL=1
MKIKAIADVRVATLTGAVLTLSKGQEKTMSEELGYEALATGKCQIVEDDAPEMETEIVEQPAPHSPPSDAPASEVSDITGADVVDEDAPPFEPEIVTAMVQLVQEADKEKLTLAGKPKAFAVRDFLGYDVGSEARENAWYHAQKALEKD